MLELVRRRAQNFTIVHQDKHKIKQIYIRNTGPGLPDLICNVIYIIFSMEFLWPRNRGLSYETSLAARSKGRWLYSRANQRCAHNNPAVLAAWDPHMVMPKANLAGNFHVTGISQFQLRPSPSSGQTPGISIFFGLGWQIHWGGDSCAVESPGVGT